MPAASVAARICEINRVEIVQNGFPNTKSKGGELDPNGMSLTKDEPGKSPNGSLKKLYEYYEYGIW